MSTRLPVTERFRRAVIDRDEHVAFRSRTLQDPVQGSSPPGWGSLSWAQYSSLVDRLSAALIGWGITPGDRVAILSGNRWEWQVGDLAVLMAGAVSVPIYPTSSAKQVSYILGHSGARACLVDDVGQLAKVLVASSEGSDDAGWSLEHVLLFGTEPYAGDAGRLAVHSWDDTLAAGADALLGDPALVTARGAYIATDDLATIVYTSGTTGPPKGVLLTHANIDAAVEMITSVVPIGPDDRFLSFLPLSHIAERVVSHFGHLASGGETWFARSISTLSEDLQDCRPTIMFAVPRVWEKAKAALDLEIHRTHGIQRWLLDRYRSLALHHLDAAVPDGSTLHDSSLHDVAERFAALEYAALDRVVGHKIRHGMGLDRARALFSGAAPIDPALLRWLVGAGLRVGEVYGQTEVTGPTTISPPGRFRIGTVGPAIPGVEVRTGDDGEVVVRGANVCRGYYRDEEATAALIGADGWMRSGDLGVLDADGYLRITGRKKDLMKTAGGKYIAPQELELRLRSCRFIANAVVVAEGRPYVTALLTLDAEAVGPWAEHHGKPISLEALAGDPDVLAEIAEEVAEVNRAVSHAEEIKRWHVLPRDLTLDGGEMTPTLKVVRPVVLDHFKDAVNQLYAR